MNEITKMYIVLALKDAIRTIELDIASNLALCEDTSKLKPPAKEYFAKCASDYEQSLKEIRAYLADNLASVSHFKRLED